MKHYDYVYDGVHSVKFWRYELVRGKWKTEETPLDSWTYFAMIPLSRPSIEIPKPNYSLVQIPGTGLRSDITPLMPGGVTYGNRSGNWQFAAPNHEEYSNWAERFKELKQYFDGSRFVMVLTDDPDTYYEGRLRFKSYEPGDSYSTVTIEYDLDAIESNYRPVDDGGIIRLSTFDDTGDFALISVARSGRQCGIVGQAGRLMNMTTGSVMNFGGDGITITARGDILNGVTLTVNGGDISNLLVSTKEIHGTRIYSAEEFNAGSFVDLSGVSNANAMMLVSIYDEGRNIGFCMTKNDLCNLAPCAYNFGVDGAILVVSGQNGSGFKFESDLSGFTGAVVSVMVTDAQVIYSDRSIAAGEVVGLSSVPKATDMILISPSGFCATKSHLIGAVNSIVTPKSAEDGSVNVTVGNGNDGFKMAVAGSISVGMIHE